MANRSEVRRRGFVSLLRERVRNRKKDLARRRTVSLIRPVYSRIPMIESLERRTLLAITLDLDTSVGTWFADGPAPAENGQIVGIQNRPVVGAVRAIATQSNLASTDFDESKIVYIGTANGGVWRTLDIDAANPTWKPLTDKLPSSAIGAIAVSPADPNVAYAGTGKFSSFHNSGTEPVGLYRSINANTTTGTPKWEELPPMKFVGAKNDTKGNIFKGLPITSIGLSPLDKNILLVGTSSLDLEGNTTNIPAGLFRSSDGALTWTKISGTINAPDTVDNNGDKQVDETDERNANDNVDNDLDSTLDESNERNFPSRTVYDIAWVPGTETVFASTGVFPFVYKSNDSGRAWEAVGAKGIDTHFGTVADKGENVRLAIHSKAISSTETRIVLYAGIVIDGVLKDVYRTDNSKSDKPLGFEWTKRQKDMHEETEERQKDMHSQTAEAEARQKDRKDRTWIARQEPDRRTYITSKDSIRKDMHCFDGRKFLNTGS